MPSKLALWQSFDHKQFIQAIQISTKQHHWRNFQGQQQLTSQQQPTTTFIHHNTLARAAFMQTAWRWSASVPVSDAPHFSHCEQLALRAMAKSTTGSKAVTPENLRAPATRHERHVDHDMTSKQPTSNRSTTERNHQADKLSSINRMRSPGDHQGLDVKLTVFWQSWHWHVVVVGIANFTTSHDGRKHRQ